MEQMNKYFKVGGRYRFKGTFKYAKTMYQGDSKFHIKGYRVTILNIEESHSGEFFRDHTNIFVSKRDFIEMMEHLNYGDNIEFTAEVESYERRPNRHSNDLQSLILKKRIDHISFGFGLCKPNKVKKIK